MSNPRYQATFDAGPGPHPDGRLKALLKIAWRRFGLRCLRCVEVTEEKPEVDKENKETKTNG